MNNQIGDIVGSSSIDQTSPSFTEDRFSNANSAYLLVTSFLELEDIDYLPTEITIAMWIRLIEIIPGQGIILSFSSYGISEICIGFSAAGSLEFSSNYQTLDSIKTLVLEKWYHLAITVSSTKASFYIDGNLTNSKSWDGIYRRIRRTNYFGKKYGTYYYPKFAFDDFMIFSKSLSADEICHIMDDNFAYETI